MIWTHAVVLGVVEGLTEFLPVSSTGHLILASRLMGLPQTEFMKSFEIAIQIGAILAVVFLYGKRLFADRGAFLRVLTAFVPTAVIGLLLYKPIKKFLFADSQIVLWSLLIGGVVLIVFDRWYKASSHCVNDTAKVPFSKAALLGVFQCLSMVPGVSRAGATQVGGLVLGLDRRTTVEFSFLLAVPTLAAATALELWKSGAAFDGAQWELLLIGGAVSFVSAVAVIRLFLRFVEKSGFTAFGIYRIVAALAFWAFVR
jgi:undecaprenyl-diphosphatase